MVPIFNSGTRRVTSTYRPVSLTSVCCKTMERLAGAHSVNFLEGNGLLSADQFGFRSGRSTEDQLLLFYGSIAKWMDRGFIIDVIFMDFSKAFDRVSHTILISKLRLLGFDDTLVNWIESFLVGRTMSVSVSGVLSTERRVTSGVPQGSVLGPILFLVYVNYITKNVRSQWKAFADDYKVYVCYPRGEHSNSGDERQALQRDIDSISNVSKSWNLSLNPLKCYAMRFGNSGAMTDDLARYYIDGQELEYVN